MNAMELFPWLNIDGFVKSPFYPIFVIPAKVGIQGFL